MSAEMIKRLSDERQRTWEQGKALIDGADEEKRSLSAEEEGQWEAINTNLDGLDKRLQALFDADKREQRAAELRSDIDKFIRPEDDPNDGDQGSRAYEEVLEAELRALLSGESRKAIEFAPPAGSTRDLRELRAIAKSSQSAGGALVPTTFYDDLLVYLFETAVLLDAGAKLIETDTGENMDFPRVTGLSTATQVAELGTITASNPTFGKLTLGAWKYTTIVEASKEMVQDPGVDLLGFIAEESGTAVGEAFGAKLINGAGTTEPQGIITGASAGVTGGTGQAGVPTADELIALFYSVISKYRNRPTAAWLLNDTTVGKIRRLKDNNGDYIWTAGLNGAPDTILGKSIYTDPNMPAAALNAKSVVFGDISRYYVRKVTGIRFERSDDALFYSDGVAFKAVIRGDGGVADPTGALKTYVGGAS